MPTLIAPSAARPPLTEAAPAEAGTAATADTASGAAAAFDRVLQTARQGEGAAPLAVPGTQHPAPAADPEQGPLARVPSPDVPPPLPAGTTTPAAGAATSRSPVPVPRTLPGTRAHGENPLAASLLAMLQAAGSLLTVARGNALPVSAGKLLPGAGALTARTSAAATTPASAQVGTAVAAESMPATTTVLSTLERVAGSADVNRLHRAEGAGGQGESVFAGMLSPSGALAQTPTAVQHAAELAAAADTPAFGAALSHEVAWMAGHDLQRARLRLHPAELGSLDVQIQVQHGRVDVAFVVQHPAAAAAVQDALTQLGALLGQQGLSLGDAHVSQRQSRARAADAEAGGRDVDEDVLAVTAADGPRPDRSGHVLVDAFA